MNGKTYTIARDPTWYPVNTEHKEQSLLAFSDDLMIAIAEKEGFRIRLVSASPNRIETGLQVGDYDAILSPLFPFPTRMTNYEFSLPYFLVGPILMVRQDSSARSIIDMKDKRVGILTRMYLPFDPENYPGTIIYSYETPNQAIAALIKGDIDGLIIDLIRAYSYAHGIYSNQIKIVGQPITHDGLRLVTTRNSSHSRLIQHFNDGLKKIRENGQYSELLKKWDLDNPPVIPN